jgi:hypothetical protein
VKVCELSRIIAKSHTARKGSGFRIPAPPQ